MAGLNKLMLIGNLGADPEVRTLPSGEKVASLRVGTTETYKDKDGNKKEATEWHRVSFFGRQAEVCEKYLKKGKQVYIEGSIRTRKWQDKDGQDKYTTEVRGERMQMLGGNPNGGGQSGARPAGAGNGAPAKPAGGEQRGGGEEPPPDRHPNDFDDDIPW